MLLAGCGGGGGSSTTAEAPPQAPSGNGLPATGDAAGAGGVRLSKVGDFDQPVYVTQAAGDHRDLFVVGSKRQPGQAVAWCADANQQKLFGRGELVVTLVRSQEFGLVQ